MSLTASVGYDSLFVYSPVSSGVDLKRAGASDTSASASTKNQPQKHENNTTQGYKNEPDEGITGEKLLSSMPTKKEENKTETKEKTDKSADNLSEEEKAQVEELKKRDAEVKTHEQAHMAAGGSYVKGGASYEYQAGPDGMRYAVGGEVQIDSGPVDGDPQATIAKARTIIAAALAPAEPSGQDRAVATQANKMMTNAQAELMQKNSETTTETGDENEIKLITDNTAKTDNSSKNEKTENNSENGNEFIADNTSKNEKIKTDSIHGIITDSITKNGKIETNSTSPILANATNNNEKTLANDPFQLMNLIDMTA